MSSKNIEAIYPLSPMQEGLLFHTLYAPGSGTYVEQWTATLHGPLTIPAFKQAWHYLIEQHSILRTLFLWERRDKPLQVVRRQVKLPWLQLDWQETPERDQHRQLKSLLQADRNQGFELSKSPLMRLTLIQTEPNRFQFIWSFHHLLLDGWSVSLLLQQLFAAYKAFCDDEELSWAGTRAYKDYIVWLQQQDLSQAETFWRQTLNGFTSPTPLPGASAGRAPSDSTAAQRELQLKLSFRTTADLQSLAQQQEVTLNTLLQAAWALLLSRYSNSGDVLFGATISGRPAALSGAENMVGLFINTLPVRIQISGRALFKPWLQRLQAQQAEARAYEYTPLVQIQNWSEIPQGRPLFETLLVFENYPVDESSWDQIDDISIRDIQFHEQTSYPLTLMVTPGAELRVHASYSDAYFSDLAVARLLEHLQTVLNGMIASPEAHLSDLPWLTAAEQREIVVEWNETQTIYPQPNLWIHQRFEAQAFLTPDAPALIFEQLSLSYRQLNQRANQLAHFLIAQGVSPDLPVGVCLERSLDLVIALLAILKAGGAYIPLDPSLPRQRLLFMLSDAQVSLLLTQQQLLSALPDQHTPTLCLDSQAHLFNQLSSANPGVALNGHHLAYTIYTSGSTGNPKGAMNSHQAILNRLLWMQHTFRLTSDDRVLQKTPFSFDVSVWEFFWPLISGACLVVARPEGHKDSAYLLDLIAQQQISTLHFVPSMLQAFLLEPDLHRCRHLRQLICSGEALSFDLQQRFFARFPAPVALHNLYGPTEAAIDVTFWSCQRQPDQHPVPIGKPIANTQMYVLDPHLQPLPVGVSGELYIGGLNLARGYHRRPALTAERFIPNPYGQAGSRLYRTGDLARYRPDGTLEYLGRTDFQVKIRGFRIELGEIEAALTQHPAILEAVVIAQDTERIPADRRLVAYIVTSQRPASLDLRAFLKEQLPDYMLPAIFVSLEHIPLTPNGKVDRKALPAPSAQPTDPARDYVAPRTPIEKTLARAWAEILGLEQVGVYDDFFELGGHSLLMTQLIFRVKQIFHIDLPLRIFFEQANIVGLADTIAQVRRGDSPVTPPGAAIDTGADLFLDPSIYPKAGTNGSSANPGSIFLTGATGFLGAYLLRDLFDSTQADIYCLVRATSVEDAQRRLRDHLESQLLWIQGMATRIIPVVGDLAQPCLGLSKEQFQQLNSQIDLIYHNGALVNFVYPYGRLKAANVFGTQEVLRLATYGKTIPLHYVSTVSVFDSLGYYDGRLISEDDKPIHENDFLNGYAQSKWVAEQLTFIARDRGVPLKIYRPGVVVGDSRTGVWKSGDFLSRFLKGCIQLGSVPDLDHLWRITPVDYVSKAIIHLSQQTDSADLFHILGPDEIHLTTFHQWLKEFGYTLAQLPYQAWLAKLIDASGQAPGHTLSPLLPMFIEPLNFPGNKAQAIFELFSQDKEPKLSCRNMLGGLSNSAIEYPPVTSQRFKAYLLYFIRTGFLEAP